MFLKCGLMWSVMKRAFRVPTQVSSLDYIGRVYTSTIQYYFIYLHIIICFIIYLYCNIPFSVFTSSALYEIILFVRIIEKEIITIFLYYCCLPVWKQAVFYYLLAKDYRMVITSI